MSELLISENIVIDDIEFVISKIEERTGLTGIESKDIEDFIKNELATLFYIDDKLNAKLEEDKNCRYLWVDTGFEEDGKPIFVSMINNYGYYEGHFTGHYEFLARGMMNYNPANHKTINDNIYKFESKYEQKASKRETKHLNPKYKGTVNAAPAVNEERRIYSVEEEAQTTSPETKVYAYGSAPIDMAYQIRKQLLVDNWKSLGGIDRYIKIIGARLWQIVEQGKDEYYVLNRIKSAIINTGMLDKFGEDIRIMYRVNLTKKTYEAYKVIESKNDYLENDFSKEQTNVRIKPINFFDGEEVFEATIEDFDINTKSLTHIINERRDRFPESIQNIPDDNLAARVKSALELGLKLAARDKTYVKASFSGKYRGIAWMMPLHINSSFTDEPELVLVINKQGEFYEIKTILPYDDGIMDRITAMTLYSKLW